MVVVLPICLSWWWVGEMGGHEAQMMRGCAAGREGEGGEGDGPLVAVSTHMWTERMS